MSSIPEVLPAPIRAAAPGALRGTLAFLRRSIGENIRFARVALSAHKLRAS
jgi:hypothetical protein